MPSTDRMTEFLEIVNTGSISGAARALGLERATLSRRLSALEAELNVRLLHRRTNKLVLTSAGQELLRRGRRVVADAEEVWAHLRRQDDEPRGLLRVSVVGPYFSELFIRYMRDFPNVELQVLSTTDHVDMLADGVDVAVRFGQISDTNLIAKKIMSDRLVVVATPEFLKRNGTPLLVSDLKKIECITGFESGWTPVGSWPLMNGKSVSVTGRLTASEIHLIRSAALDGLGCAFLPSSYVADFLKTGQLKTVLAEDVGAEMPLHLVYPDREYMDPKVRIFLDRAAEAIAKDMPQRAEGL